MEKKQPDSARVWDRVRSAAVPAPDAQSILGLIAEEMADAAAYQKLAQRLPSPLAAIAKQISREEQSHVACLKGVYTLITGQKPLVPPPAVSDDGPEIVLRRCYGREMRCLSQYEARQSDPQYGHIFRTLAQQEKAHCHRILEILGAITK